MKIPSQKWGLWGKIEVCSVSWTSLQAAIYQFPLLLAYAFNHISQAITIMSTLINSTNRANKVCPFLSPLNPPLLPISPPSPFPPPFRLLSYFYFTLLLSSLVDHHRHGFLYSLSSAFRAPFFHMCPPFPHYATVTCDMKPNGLYPSYLLEPLHELPFDAPFQGLLTTPGQ